MKIRELNECENCGKPKAKHVGYDWNCPVLPEEKLMDFLASAATTIFVPIRVVECKELAGKLREWVNYLYARCEAEHHQFVLPDEIAERKACWIYQTALQIDTLVAECEGKEGIKGDERT